MIQILTRRCVGCGACVKDCVSGVFRMKDGTPEPLHPAFCNRCSHCIAVCPTQAIVHKGLGSSHTRRIDQRLIRARSFREIALTRRSIRHYTHDPVPREVLAEIIDVARYSPTASNTQNVHYTVITDRESLRRVSRKLVGIAEKIHRILDIGPVKSAQAMLKGMSVVQTLNRYSTRWEYYKEQIAAGRDLIFHNAPSLLLIHAPRGQNLSRDNCLIAAATIAQYAHAMGLGTCFIGILTIAMRIDRSLYEEFRIPEGHRVHAALTIGYPALRHVYHVVRKPPSVQWL